MLPLDWYRLSATLLLLGCSLGLQRTVLATEPNSSERSPDQSTTQTIATPIINKASDLAPATSSNPSKPQPQPPVKTDSELDSADARQPDSTDIAPTPATSEPTPEPQLQQALAVANNLDDPLGKATLLSGIARQYAELGQPDTAAAILAQALQTAGKITNKALKRTMRAEIARQYIALDQPSQAQAIVEQLNNANDQVGLMLALAADYIEADQPDQAATLLSETVARANTITDKTPRVQRLTEIALAYNQINQPELANQLIVQSQNLLAQVAQGFPFQPQPLQGTLGFGLSANSFDTSTALLSLNADFQKQWPVSDVTFAGDIVFDYDSSRSVNQLRPGGLIGFNYRRHANRKWQYFTNLVVQLNNGFLASSTEDEDTTSSGLLVVGKGLNLWRGKSPERFLDLQVGVGASYLSDELRSANLSANRVDPVLFVSLWSRSIPIDKAKIDQTLSFVTAVDEFSRFEIFSRTKLSIPLNERLSFTNTLQLLYRNEKILETNPNWNVSFTMGLGFSF